MPHLFWTDYDKARENLTADWLSPREHLHLQTFPSERRRRNWMAGRLAAKTLISRYLHERENLSPALADIEIDYATGGGPQAQVNGHVLSNFSLSIAHSHGHGFAGLSLLNKEGRIGVDLERIRPVNEKLARRILTATEQETFRVLTHDQEHERLILYWTLKEAALKALKPILAVSMKQLEVQIEKNQGQAQIHLPLSSRGITLEAHYQREGVFLSAYALAPIETALIATQ